MAKLILTFTHSIDEDGAAAAAPAAAGLRGGPRPRPGPVPAAGPRFSQVGAVRAGGGGGEGHRARLGQDGHADMGSGRAAGRHLGTWELAWTERVPTIKTLLHM